MRLGDVLEHTADASIAARPKPKWRGGRLLLGSLCLSLAILAFVHGPVLIFPEEDDRVVLTTRWGFGHAASTTHDETDGTVLFVTPLVQSSVKIDGTSHTSRMAVMVATREGVPIEVPQIDVKHAVRPGAAHGVHQALGPTASARSTLVMALARKALVERAASMSFEELTTGEQLAAALESEEGALSDALAPHGIRLLHLEIASPKLPDEFLDLAQRRNRAQATLAAAAKAKDDAHRNERRQLAKAKAAQDARLAALEESHREALEEARSVLSKAQDAADEAYLQGIRGAKGERAAMLVEAKAIERNAPGEAIALGVRIEAMGPNGSALLDWTIMNRVIPQLTTAPREAAAPRPTSPPVAAPPTSTKGPVPEKSPTETPPPPAVPAAAIPGGTP